MCAIVVEGHGHDPRPKLRLVPWWRERLRTQRSDIKHGQPAIITREAERHTVV
jgi:hypothetical protein